MSVCYFEVCCIMLFTLMLQVTNRGCVCNGVKCLKYKEIEKIKAFKIKVLAL